MMPPFMFHVGKVDSVEYKELILIFLGSVVLTVVAVLLVRAKKKYDAAHRALTGINKKHDAPEMAGPAAAILTL